MATALDILKRSMRLIGALGAGEEPTAEEGSDGLAALNSMLDAWWLKSLAVYYTASEVFTWASGNVSRTMGPGGNFSTTRPARIVGAFQRVNSIDYPIQVLSGREEYDRLPDKATTSTMIDRLYVEYQASLAYLYAYPVPSVSLSVHIQSLARLQAFSTLATTVALPPGYQRALEYNLALEIAPEYQVQVPPLVARNALSSLATIKANNVEIPRTLTDAAFLSTRNSGFNIYAGT